MSMLQRLSKPRTVSLVACCAFMMALFSMPMMVNAAQADTNFKPPANETATSTKSGESSESGEAAKDDAALKKPAPAKAAPKNEVAKKAEAKNAESKQGKANKKATPRRRPTPRRNSRASRTLTPDPNAKWACDQTAVKVEPAWKSAGESVDFAFKIRNEGTAPLKIRAKGG